MVKKIKALIDAVIFCILLCILLNVSMYYYQSYLKCDMVNYQRELLIKITDIKNLVAGCMNGTYDEEDLLSQLQANKIAEFSKTDIDEMEPWMQSRYQILIVDGSKTMYKTLDWSIYDIGEILGYTGMLYVGKDGERVESIDIVLN